MQLIAEANITSKYLGV